MVGGVILFPASSTTLSHVRASVSRMQRAAHAGHNPTLLVAIDQEGGLVKRLPAGPPDLSAPQMGAAGSPKLAQSQGRATGRFLRGVGINVDLAPVLDVPGSSDSFIAPRAFSSSPQVVGEMGSAFAVGLTDADVASTAKHFPGLGLATANTDQATSIVNATTRQLAPGLVPFGQAINQGIPLVMLSTAIYPAFDPDHAAALSPAIVGGVLREQLGFRGVRSPTIWRAKACRNGCRLRRPPWRASRRVWTLLCLHTAAKHCPPPTTMRFVSRSEESWEE